MCDGANSIEASVCSACGSPLAATLNPPKPRVAPRDPGLVALYSLLLPGAGHACLGLWGQAVARAVTTAWVLSIASIEAWGRGPASPPAAFFGLVSLLLWVGAAHDAYREAKQDPGAVVLGDRSIAYLVVVLLALSGAAVVMSALGVSR